MTVTSLPLPYTTCRRAGSKKSTAMTRVDSYSDNEALAYIIIFNADRLVDDDNDDSVWHNW